MKIHLAILFAVIAICSGQRKRFLVNQYKYDIPVHNTPLRPRYDLPITPGKPAEVYGVPLEYQVPQPAVQPPIRVVKPVISKYKYNIEAPITTPVIKFPQLVRYPIEENPKPNTVSTYKYKTESPVVHVVQPLPLAPYPAAIPVTKVVEPVVNSYKFKIEPSLEPTLPLAPYPPAVLPPSVPLAPYPPALPISPKPVISQYKYKIEPPVKPSLPLAPYPPAVPTAPVQKLPVAVNKYKYTIEPTQLPSAPYPPALPIPPKPVISQYKYKVEPPVKPSLPLAPYPPAVPTAPVQKLPVAVNKYKYTIEPTQLPSAPYPPAVFIPEVVKSVPVINKYKFKIEPSVVPSLPSAPYPPAIPVPVVPRPNVINSYKFNIEPTVVPAPYPAAVPPTQVKKTQRPVVNQYSYRVETPVKKIETTLPAKTIEIEETVKNGASKPAVFQYKYVLPYEEVRKVPESQVVIPKPHAVYGVPL